MIDIDTPFFSFNLINGYFGDPAILGSHKNIGTTFLLDCGNLENLPKKELLKVSHVFISHTHIDHFIGFDKLLRVNIPHFKKLHFFGPKGIAKNIQGKLNGYTWNLLKPDQINYEITEILSFEDSDTYSINSTDQYELHLISSKRKDTCLATIKDDLVVSGTLLDHGSIKSAGYRFSLSKKIVVDGKAMTDDRLPKGPWISQIQKQLSTEQAFDESHQTEISGTSFQTTELVKKYFTICDPVSFGYITDLAFSDQNRESLKKLFGNLTFLISEASFLDEDEEKALDKSHLTTKQAATIANQSGCSNLYTFHYSNIYGKEPETHHNEIKSFFSSK